MIGEVAKWVGMIACDDVEMKRERKSVFGVKGLVMSLKYCKSA